MSLSARRESPVPSGTCASCTRREFVSASVLGTVTALLAACGDGVIGGINNSITGPSATVSLTVKLSDYPALGSVGGIATLNGTTTPIAVVRTGTASYIALSLSCPHQGTTVGIRGNGFLCPNHRATFSSTGAWTGGQGTSALATLATTLDAAAGTLAIAGTVRRGGGGGDDDDDDD